MQKTIGMNVRALRMQHGFSQGQLAAKINMSKSWLQNLEYGTFLPPVHYLIELAAVLQVDLTRLCAQVWARQSLAHPRARRSSSLRPPPA